MFVLSLLVFVLLVYDSHGETSTCDRKIESLRKDLLRLENENKIMTAQLSDFQRIKSEINKMSDDIVELRSTRKRQISSNQVIAFHAYLSIDISPSGINHPIKFDKEMTDKGQAYNPYTGAYTVPETGVYVFTWTIIVVHTVCDTELVLNNAVIGQSYPDSQHDNDYASATQIVVVEANRGDAVFVRAKTGCSSIIGNTATRSAFSGWKLL